MKYMILCAATLIAGMATAAPSPQNKVTVPAGTRILVRTIDSIDTTKQKTGYRFTASIADIDTPRSGVIRVHPQNLASLAESLQSQ